MLLLLASPAETGRACLGLRCGSQNAAKRKPSNSKPGNPQELKPKTNPIAQSPKAQSPITRKPTQTRHLIKNPVPSATVPRGPPMAVKPKPEILTATNTIIILGVLPVGP